MGEKLLFCITLRLENGTAVPFHDTLAVWGHWPRDDSVMPLSVLNLLFSRSYLRGFFGVLTHYFSHISTD